MLQEFRFSNYKSFRDEACLSMEAAGLGAMKDSLLPAGGRKKYLPVAAIFGKNGGGKSNVIRAFWLCVQFVCSAQRIQRENSPVPVCPFLLDDSSRSSETSFEFSYIFNGVKYRYGFSATRTQVTREYLYHAPKGQMALVFSRSGQDFRFRKNAEWQKRELMRGMVAPNQLFFSVACTMNDAACSAAMGWFRSCVRFTRDYSDIPRQLLEYSDDPDMLQAISSWAKHADVGIDSMTFEVSNELLPADAPLPKDLPENVKAALAYMIRALSEGADGGSVIENKKSTLHVTSLHHGLGPDGQPRLYPLSLSDESGGTLELMRLAPAVEATLSCGGVLVADELEKKLHPFLVAHLVAKFQNPVSNPKHAQLIFTTHDAGLLDPGILRKDEIYFVDKDRESGSSSLYSISDSPTPTSENVRKGYLIGKYGAVPELEGQDDW